MRIWILVIYVENTMRYQLSHKILDKSKGELHIITINYIPYCILHSKLFKCTFCTLNYYFCYTLHLDVKVFFFFSLSLSLSFWIKVKLYMSGVVVHTPQQLREDLLRFSLFPSFIIWKNQKERNLNSSDIYIYIYIYFAGFFEKSLLIYLSMKKLMDASLDLIVIRLWYSY